MAESGRATKRMKAIGDGAAASAAPSSAAAAESVASWVKRRNPAVDPLPVTLLSGELLLQLRFRDRCV